MFLVFHNTRSTNPLALLSRARRIAHRDGYRIIKSRRRSIENRGGFMVVDTATGFAVAGFSYDLDEAGVLAWMTDDETASHG